MDRKRDVKTTGLKQSNRRLRCFLRPLKSKF